MANSLYSPRIQEMLSEAEPSQLKVAEEEQLRDDNFSYHSAASSSWSLAGKLPQEERQETHEDPDIKVSTCHSEFTCNYHPRFATAQVSFYHMNIF